MGSICIMGAQCLSSGSPRAVRSRPRWRLLASPSLATTPRPALNTTSSPNQTRTSGGACTSPSSLASPFTGSLFPLLPLSPELEKPTPSIAFDMWPIHIESHAKRTQLLAIVPLHNCSDPLHPTLLPDLCTAAAIPPVGVYPSANGEPALRTRTSISKSWSVHRGLVHASARGRVRHFRRKPIAGLGSNCSLQPSR